MQPCNQANLYTCYIKKFHDHGNFVYFVIRWSYNGNSLQYLQTGRFQEALSIVQFAEFSQNPLSM